ncbi:MAG TPA: enoyl-CoA hydratase/isomerase family protein [Pyrinomonadaceae bacterium]|nr:enoyl-CoA hydratase/isomerase family protein [Pyrinomonadaceae bacterium]
MLIVERRNSVLLITLNRPEKRNSLHPDLIRELAQALTQTETDETLNAVVITGAGTSFCAGLDLIHLLSLDAENKFAYVQTAFALFHRLYTLPQPVIAAINGPAMAGGFDLAAFCDFRLCAPEAKFAQTEILLGLTQIMYPLYKVIGMGRAKELALTGEAISAEEAYRIGLVNRIYPSEELLEQALKLAETLAKRPREALFATKRLSRELIEMDTESAMNRIFEAFSERLRSEEHRHEIENYVTSLKRRR